MPATTTRLIVMEHNGDLQIFDIQTASVTQHASNVGSISWPSIGGGLVAYSAGGGIAFRHLNDITLESELDGPCANHGDPRVSRNGTIILHAGRGCPSGSDGIFVTYLEPDGSQELYKLHDLPQMPIRDRDIYSIASTSVGFIDNQNTIRYFELVP